MSEVISNMNDIAISEFLDSDNYANLVMEELSDGARQKLIKGLEKSFNDSIDNIIQIVRDAHYEKL